MFLKKILSNLATYIMDESHEDLYKGNTAWRYLHSLVGKRMMFVLLGIFYSWIFSEYWQINTRLTVIGIIEFKSEI